MRSAVLLAAASLVFVTGCPRPAGQAPTSRREALERVNENLSRSTAAQSCAALVSFSFQDERGKRHSFVGHEARLLFQPPRLLRFDVRSLAGTVAQFGADEDVYWLWIDVPELRKLWWGSWHRVGSSSNRKLPVPPNELLDALMLRPLPESLEGGQLPILRVDGDDHRLIYVRLEGRQPAGWREVRLDPRPPYQPLEIVDRSADGRVIMQAELSGYDRIGRDGPLTPRRYVVRWPAEDGATRAEMRLDILHAALRTDLTPAVFEFPAEWSGETELVDPPADDASQP